MIKPRLYLPPQPEVKQEEYNTYVWVVDGWDNVHRFHEECEKLGALFMSVTTTDYRRRHFGGLEYTVLYRYKEEIDIAIPC